MIKDKIKIIIERRDTKIGRIFDYSIQAFIFISIISFAFETIQNLNPEFLKILYIEEIILVIIFTIEYLLRIYVADNKIKFIFSFYGLIDLFAVLPFYINSGIDLRSIRIFRFIRLIRLMKFFRYSRAVKRYKEAFHFIKAELIMFLAAAGFLFYIASVGIYYFENPAQPEKFSSIFDCMWWSIATLTTIGYGDIYPITIGGKIFTSLVVIIGLGIVAVPTGLIASALTKALQIEKENEI